MRSKRPQVARPVVIDDRDGRAAVGEEIRLALASGPIRILVFEEARACRVTLPFQHEFASSFRVLTRERKLIWVASCSGRERLMATCLSINSSLKS